MQQFGTYLELPNVPEGRAPTAKDLLAALDMIEWPEHLGRQAVRWFVIFNLYRFQSSP